MINERKPLYKVIPLKDLHLANYQRNLSVDRVEKIIKNYDSEQLQVIDVSYRDNKYYIVDGQHRVAALVKMQSPDVMAKIHFNLSYEEEANLFDVLNKGRQNPTALDHFKAMLESKNPMALDIKKIVESNGFVLGLDKGKSINRIISVATLQLIYRGIGADGLSRTLYLSKNSWPAIMESVDRRILSGIYIFIKKYGVDLNNADFIKSMSKILPSTIITEGQALPDFPGTNSYTPFGMIILKYYNKGRRYQFQNKF